LPEPLSRLLVLGRSDGPPESRMALAAVLVPTPAGGTAVLSPFGLGRHPGATRIPRELAASFHTRSAGPGFYVLDPAGDERFLVAPGLMRHVTVTCGLWPVLRQLIGPRAAARPAADPAAVAEDLDAFCGLLHAVVTAMYVSQEMPVPALDLALRPTGTSVEGALAGLRRLTRTTLSRLPTARGPGEVYEPPAGGEPGEEATSFAD